MASEDDDTIEELVYTIKGHNFELFKGILNCDIDVNKQHTVSFSRWNKSFNNNANNMKVYCFLAYSYIIDKKEIKCEAWRTFNHLFTISLNNLIQGHGYLILIFIHGFKLILKSYCSRNC